MLDKNVEVIGGLSPKAGIAQCGGILLAARAAVGSESHRLGDVLGIGPRDTAPIGQSQVRISREGIAQRDTGKHLEVRASGFIRQSVCCGVEGNCFKVGGLEAHASHQADFAAEIDRVHQVSGANFFY